MRYLNLYVEYKLLPKCAENMMSALYRLGELNPNHLVVRKWSKKETLNYYNYVKLGALNVKQRLNNRTRTGKYSTTMILQSARTLSIQREDGSWIISAKIPGRDFLKIVAMTYTQLYAYDESFCKRLLGLEDNDVYPGKEQNKTIATKTIAPIQTNIILLSQGRNVNIQKELDYIKNVVMGG